MRKNSKRSNKDRKSFPETSKADPINDILDIHDKPDVAIWNKTVRTQTKYEGNQKIGSLSQNLVREDTIDPIDPASKESVAETVISGTQLTDRVDLSKLDRKSKK